MPRCPRSPACRFGHRRRHRSSAVPPRDARSTRFARCRQGCLRHGCRRQRIVLLGEDARTTHGSCPFVDRRYRVRRHRFAKIIATLGPATAAPETIRALFMAGVDVFRLNFSHGDHDAHRRSYDAIRALESTTGRPIGVLLDLQGPKLRIGRFASGHVTLVAGRVVCPRPRSVTREPGAGRTPSSGGFRRHQAGHESPPRRRQGPAGSRDVRCKLRGHARQDRRRNVGSQGGEHPRRRAAHLSPDRQGPGGPRARAGAGCGLGGGIVHPAATGPARAP